MVTVDCPKQPFARKLPNWVAEQAGGALDEFHRALARQLTFRFGNDEALPACQSLAGQREGPVSWRVPPTGGGS